MKASLVNPTMARLKEAICDGRMYQTRHLLESGVDVNFLDEQGLTPLMRAAQLPDEKSRTRHNLLKLLLQYGANVNIVDQKGRHVLSRACIDEKDDIVRLLCNVANQDVDLNLRDFEGNTPLMHSVRAGNVALVKFLVDELNKFQVDIDVRNHEDRTPYLEAKRLGYEECAAILLKEGHASPNIQVNPFLDFVPLKDEGSWQGRVRGVEENKYRIKSSDAAKKHPNPRDIQKKKTPTKKAANFYDEKSVTYHEKILKRKTTSPRKLSSANLAKDDTEDSEKLRPTRRRKLAWHTRHMTESISRNEEEIAKENDLNATESGQSGEPTGEVDSVIGVRPSSQAKAIFIDKQEITSSRLEMTPVNDTISSVEFTRTEKHRQSPKITPKLPADSTTVGRKLTESRPELKMARKHLRSRSLISIKSKDAMDDNCSWYSHFSVYNSPSVAFLTKIMSIYAEQMSPESSFRFGVNPEKMKKADEPMVLKISVAATETVDDLRSEGDRSPLLRSSLSSRNNSPTGSVSNRKFQSAVTRTVASYLTGPKRSLSTLKVQDLDF